MSNNGDITIVIAVFVNDSAAVGALAGLEHWAETRKDIELGAVGAMRKEDGDVSAEIVRKADKGMLVSSAMGLAKSLLGPFVLVGNVVGGLAKSVFGEPEEGTSEALEKLGAQMDVGGTTLVMISTTDDVDAYREQLETMCGAVTHYEVPQEVLEEAAAAAEAAQAEEKKEEES